MQKTPEGQHVCYAIRTIKYLVIAKTDIVTAYSTKFVIIKNFFIQLKQINLLTPNVNYSGRTASLTSKVAFYIFIQQI